MKNSGIQETEKKRVRKGKKSRGKRREKRVNGQRT